jgi:hypothetical protein
LPYLLIKEKRIAQLICGKPGKNRHNKPHTNYFKKARNSPRQPSQTSKLSQQANPAQASPHQKENPT